MVRVKVLGVDLPRQRIALSMRLDDEPGGQTGRDRPRRDQPGRDQRGGISRQAGGAMADALRRAGLAGRPAGETPARETRDRRSH